MKKAFFFVLDHGWCRLCSWIHKHVWSGTFVATGFAIQPCKGHGSGWNGQLCDRMVEDVTTSWLFSDSTWSKHTIYGRRGLVSCEKKNTDVRWKIPVPPPPWEFQHCPTDHIRHSECSYQQNLILRQAENLEKCTRLCCVSLLWMLSEFETG